MIEGVQQAKQSQSVPESGNRQIMQRRGDLGACECNADRLQRLPALPEAKQLELESSNIERSLDYARNELDL